MFLDFAGHPAAEDECFLHAGGGEELQGVVYHRHVSQRQQSLLAIMMRQVSGQNAETNQNTQVDHSAFSSLFITTHIGVADTLRSSMGITWFLVSIECCHCLHHVHQLAAI